MAKKSIIDHELLLIGGSAGSLEVILQLLPAIPAAFPLPIVLVLHRKSGESMLTELFADKTSLTVQEAEEKDEIRAGMIYIAPPDYHLLVEHDRTFSLDYSEKINYSRPSIDVTFESAVDVYGDQVAGMLLSGANADGADGLKLIHESGGLTIVQDPVDASVSYMPQQAIAKVDVDYILDTEGLARLIKGNM